MKNNTKSKIIITMKHLDHADKLVKFLKSLPKDTGGDTVLYHDNQKYHIGHDINVRKIQHVIFED